MAQDTQTEIKGATGASSAESAVLTDGLAADDAKKLAILKASAHEKRIDAGRAWYAYACAVDVGDERTWAFDVYEKIRTATRRV